MDVDVLVYILCAAAVAAARTHIYMLHQVFILYSYINIYMGGGGEGWFIKYAACVLLASHH